MRLQFRTELLLISGTIALLVSLSLVIYGFQLSRGGKLTQKAKRHYHIIILSLIVPGTYSRNCCLVYNGGIPVSTLQYNGIFIAYSSYNSDHSNV